MYENLISSLRTHAEWAHANEWESPITLGDDLEEAIKAIEALVRDFIIIDDLKHDNDIEIEELKAENARLRREREADEK